MKTVKNPSKVIIIPRPPVQNQQADNSPEQAGETEKVPGQETKETASSEEDTVQQAEE
jgi:hypothetical protein